MVPCRFAAAVREGSIAAHTARRAERHPVGRPSVSNGEFANVAASVGPTSCASTQRDSTASACAPESRFTWTDAVLRIIVRPSGHRVSKYVSIAR